MIHSMTAFARQSVSGEAGQVTIELKSVNHRFSEVSLRLPEDFRYLEPQIRERITKLIKRGKVDCNIKYQPPDMQSNGVEIDKTLLGILTTANREIEAIMQDVAPSRAADFLKWPGVIKAPEQDIETLGKQILALLDQGLNELVTSRQREGAQLKSLIEARCEAIQQEVEKVKSRIPIALEAIRQRLKERLEEWKVELDETRLEQEMVMQINKTDVAEEIDRLNAHVEEVHRVLAKGSPVGRRLDFLMQELNREANTLASKSVDAELTRSSVELKVLIEQMREQIQNIE